VLYIFICHPPFPTLEPKRQFIQEICVRRHPMVPDGRRRFAPENPLSSPISGARHPKDIPFSTTPYLFKRLSENSEDHRQNHKRKSALIKRPKALLCFCEIKPTGKLIIATSGMAVVQQTRCHKLISIRDKLISMFPGC
jgi:hypothetical protein